MMSFQLPGKGLSSFQIIVTGFGTAIALGTLLLMLPASARSNQWTSLDVALFTATSAVCVTGLVVRDTALYWSSLGQGVILFLIQIGGLGIISVTAFIAAVSGRKISLLQRSMLQESISAHQVGGIVKMMIFVFKLAFIMELSGALLMLPLFCRTFGFSGIWMSVFHSVSAFCNAGFDIMGDKTGAFSSLTYFGESIGIVLPVCLLIMIGGIGFLTWDDIVLHRFSFKKYRLQSKISLTATVFLIFLPAAIFFFHDFSTLPLKRRFCLSIFQAVTPRTAGFNTIDLSAVTGTGRAMTIALMLIGGSPGSTAGGLKTTTAAVLLANTAAVIRRKKSPQLFGRRIEDQTIKNAASLLVLYLLFTLTGAFIICLIEDIPFGAGLFETSSAIGTVGLSVAGTSSLGLISRMILVLLMFWGRVGGLTFMFAAVTGSVEVSRYQDEKINVG